MTFNEMIQKTKTTDGIGAAFYRADHEPQFLFYENFPGSGELGIDRASRHFHTLHEAGAAYKAIYYWKGHTGCATIGELIKIHIYDLTHEGREIHTRQDGTIYKVYSKEGKAGIDYAGEFTPLDHFSTENGAVAFEIIA